MKISYCRLNFRKLSVSQFTVFSNEIRNGIYNNTDVFPSPPLTAAAFEQAYNEFSTTAADYKQYGITAKTAAVNARNYFLDLLESLTSYVDIVANGDRSVIALSGFTPNLEKIQRVDTLDKIMHFTAKVTNVSGQIIVDIPTIKSRGLISYNCLCVKGAPLHNPTIINGQISLESDSSQILHDSNRSKQKVFVALTPGVQYYFYVYASTSNSVSPISDAKMVWVS